MTMERFSRVLVVEDSQHELELLCDILREEKFEVVGCSSAADAIEQVKRHSFGVAVVDLRLPDLDGNQVLELIRSCDEQVRVIIYTGAASYDSVKQAINRGAFAYVEKLSDPGELLGHVHRACRERVDRYATDLEAAVHDRTEQLARSNRELENFASVVAHDLRSPLLTVSGYCQVLREEYGKKLGEEAEEYLEHILGGVERMHRLIEDLLNYSRVGPSGEPVEQVDVEGVLVQVQANLELAIRENDVQIEVCATPTVAGNQTQLIQLFQNLISNAIKFRRTERPRVVVDAHDNGDTWQISVADNGIGIGEEDFDTIFQVFKQVHGKEYPGTGIGLAVCKKIVECHGGRIWLESAADQGTTFYFTLPKPRRQDQSA